MSEIIRAYERTAFKRCRRAWDFGSRSRQNYEPLVPARAFDLEKAVHDALALWYFPGMWEWDRSLVRGFAMEGFHKSMRKQLDAYAAVADVSEAQDEEWQAQVGEGERLLDRYFAWAPGVDAFSPVRVDTDFDANVPDPAAVGVDLVAPGGGLIWFKRLPAEKSATNLQVQLYGGKPVLTSPNSKALRYCKISSISLCRRSTPASPSLAQDTISSWDITSESSASTVIVPSI